MKSAALAAVYFAALLFWTRQSAAITLLSLGTVMGVLSMSAARPLSKRGVVTLSALLFYLSATAVSTIVLDSPEIWLRVLLLPAVAFGCVAAANLNPAQAVRAAILMGLSCAMVSVLMYFQTGPTDIDLSMTRLLTRNRTDGYYVLHRFFEGAPTIGGPLGVGVVSLTVAALVGKGTMRLLFGCLAATLLGLQILSVSRGALVGTVTAVALTGTLLLSAEFSLGRIALLITATITAIVTGYIAFDVAVESIPSVAKFSTMFAGTSDTSLSARTEVWRYYLDLASVEGYGFSYWQKEITYGDYTTHNEVLGQWMAAGVFSAIAYVALLLLWLIRGLHALRMGAQPMGLMSIALLVFFFVAGLVEHYTASSSGLLLPMFWFSAALFILTDPRRTHSAGVAET